MTKKEEKFREIFLGQGGVCQIFKKEHTAYLNPLDDLLAETLT